MLRTFSSFKNKTALTLYVVEEGAETVQTCGLYGDPPGTFYIRGILVAHIIKDEGSTTERFDIPTEEIPLEWNQDALYKWMEEWVDSHEPNEISVHR